MSTLTAESTLHTATSAPPTDSTLETGLLELARVCEAAARGDLEVRALNGPTDGPLSRCVDAINHLLDITDAYVRESSASLDAAAKGKFYRRVILRGLPGSFRNGARLINAGTEEMKNSAAALAAARARQDQLANEFETTVQTVVNSVASAATEFEATAKSLADQSHETTERAEAVTSASQESSASVDSVASAATELQASAAEIDRQTQQSAQLIHSAATEATRTDAVIQELCKAQSRIGSVVKLIHDIASQTNLLALNATIEAAHAGAAGKGFGVVASEVKALSKETAAATDNIETEIRALNKASTEAAAAIARISKAILSVNESTNLISSSIAEQKGATEEISRNTQRAAQAVVHVTRNIAGVNTAAHETGVSVTLIQDAAGELSRQAERLCSSVSAFMNNIRAK